MNIPEELPYRGQVVEAVKNNNLQKFFILASVETGDYVFMG